MKEPTIEEACIKLFEGEEVIVPEQHWHSASPFRRAIFRKRKEFERMYQKEVTVSAKLIVLDGKTYCRLIPDLTKYKIQRILAKPPI